MTVTSGDIQSISNELANEIIAGRIESQEEILEYIRKKNIVPSETIDTLKEIIQNPDQMVELLTKLQKDFTI